MYHYACPDCVRQLLNTFWRLEEFFAVLATSSNFFLAKCTFRAHIKHENVKEFIGNFNLWEFLKCKER